MLHESLKVTEVLIKESAGFRMTVRKWEAMSPDGLFNVDFIQETLNNGEVVQSSTYNYFMTREELRTLAGALVYE